jgi:hypothetical protein
MRNVNNLIVVVGGQAFPIKLRRTKERSVSSMLLEPPYNTDTMRKDPFAPPMWRQMKCVVFLLYVSMI